MDLGLQGKVIVVSGGGSGIGESISRGALTEGAKVAVITRMTDAALRFEEWVQQQQVDCIILPAELGDIGQCQQAIADVYRHYGQIDGLVNNAGVNDGVGLEHGSPERFAASLQQNLVHTYTLAYAALPHLKATAGSIVTISSKVAVTGQGGTSAYAAAKGAQLALTREWAAELLPYRIRVNAVLPSEVMTPLYRQWLDTLGDPEARQRSIEANVPLDHRFTTPEEIAAAVLFLLSPLQSAHTTGQHIYVDGGYVHLDRVLT
ncbi:MAG: SDR family oxidoreductase [Janthinobacterium lividum]